ncbi:fructose PTS transporter subunit IIB [Corynebacterium liangguodongii]|uniref:PTS lactose transporter subunit IIC n=1 Tax=Corynebacterium liangguodongii TaxID=2079535 RepID=A0A2S0WEG0_9CORY|nr:fructose PTS transporter subunit IIB [Corynebacterium liangguodongii]AWB84167.1 PTS lactose transporter subunit IIC [Corynebacterium liangguodongii]PWC00178.1 PTS lactose transporter subunit IIC [Corynebacterium liangguodongii]
MISARCVALDVDLGDSPGAVISALTGMLADEGAVADAGELCAAALRREGASGTGVAGRIAIPHARTDGVLRPAVACARLSRPVDFSGPDGDADLVFFLAVPSSEQRAHLKVLSSLARALARGGLAERLRAAESPQDAADEISRALGGAGAPRSPAATIAAVTACPTGVAHTYLAAEALEAAAREREGVVLRVETQGASGTDALDPGFIAQADAVILAADVAVLGAERFAGKPLVECSTREAIDSPGTLIDAALSAPARNPAREPSPGPGLAGRVWGAAMTSLSVAVPLAVTAAALTALGDVTGAWGLVALGAAAHMGLAPALSGSIAWALGGRAAVAPGLIGGVLAAGGASPVAAVLSGVAAGACAGWLRALRPPRALAPLAPFFTLVLTPALGALAVGALTWAATGALGAAQEWHVPPGVAVGAGVLLAAACGAAMCYDLGGPVNKAAYFLAVAGLVDQGPASACLAAAVMAAGMTPPLAYSAAAAVAPRLFSPAERAAATTAWLSGLAFITEAARPFGPGPAVVLGGAVAGAVSVACGAQTGAPHGGAFVWFTFASPLAFAAAVAAGVAVAGGGIVAARWRPHARVAQTGA